MNMGEQLSYIAGMVDGEGCLTLHKIGNKGKFNYAPMVIISNNHKGVLVWIQSVFPNFKLHERKPKNPLHGLHYKLTLCKQSEILSFIVSILPYLKIKQKRAKYLARYIKSRLLKVHVRGQHYAVSKFEKALAVLMLNETIRYSKKGRVAYV